MTAALAYLTQRTVVNRLRRQARQMRNPRYALALLLGFGWLGAVVWQRTGSAGTAQPGGP